MAAVVAGAVASQGFSPLPISLAHAERAGRLVTDHRDPFDRMLAAQAIAEGLMLLSNDDVFDRLTVTRVW